MADFLNMGGYGSYIWPAYSAVFIVLIGLGISSFRNQMNMAKDVKILKETRFTKSEKDI